MNDTDILNMILQNLKSYDKHIIIRDNNGKIIFPKDLKSIKEIENLTSYIKKGKEFKANGNNYAIRTKSFYYNGENYIFDIIENNNKLKRYEEKSNHDIPTKLLNKDAILKKIDNYLLNQENDLKELAIVICDIDSFKGINDTYGHVAGDKILENVSRIFIEYEEKFNNFVTGRFGGDEFVFVFKNTNSATVNKIINKIKSHIESEIVEDNNNKIKITMSFGIYAIDGFIPIEFTTLNDVINKREEMFETADKALYDSKRNGKNKITIIVNQEKKFRVI